MFFFPSYMVHKNKNFFFWKNYSRKNIFSGIFLFEYQKLYFECMCACFNIGVMSDCAKVAMCLFQITQDIW